MKSQTKIAIMLMTFIIVQIVMIIYIWKNKSAIDADPLVVAANKYNIDSCTCYLDTQRTLFFNKTESKFIINKFGVTDEPG